MKFILSASLLLSFPLMVFAQGNCEKNVKVTASLRYEAGVGKFRRIAQDLQKPLVTKLVKLKADLEKDADLQRELVSLSKNYKDAGHSFEMKLNDKQSPLNKLAKLKSWNVDQKTGTDIAWDNVNKQLRIISCAKKDKIKDIDSIRVCPIIKLDLKSTGNTYFADVVLEKELSSTIKDAGEFDGADIATTTKEDYISAQIAEQCDDELSDVADQSRDDMDFVNESERSQIKEPVKYPVKEPTKPSPKSPAGSGASHQ